MYLGILDGSNVGVFSPRLRVACANTTQRQQPARDARLNLHPRYTSFGEIFGSFYSSTQAAQAGTVRSRCGLAARRGGLIWRRALMAARSGRGRAGAWHELGDLLGGMLQE